MKSESFKDPRSLDKIIVTSSATIVAEHFNQSMRNIIHVNIIFDCYGTESSDNAKINEAILKCLKDIKIYL